MIAIKAPTTLNANSARLVFQGSTDGTTYAYIGGDDAARYTVTVGTTNTDWLEVDPTDMKAFRYVKVQVMQADGTTAVTQTVNRLFSYSIDLIVGTA
jgi:hypothetical protein